MTTATERSEPPTRPGHRTWRQRLIWPGGLILMVATLVTVDITMLMVASGDPSFAVTPVEGDPSEAWNRHREQERRNDDLAWGADLSLALPVDRPAEAVIELRDADGSPLTDATVSLVAYHHARAADRRKAVLIADPDAPGTYRGSVRIAREGRWAFEVACVRGDDRFTSEAERFVMLPTTPGHGTAGATG